MSQLSLNVLRQRDKSEEKKWIEGGNQRRWILTNHNTLLLVRNQAHFPMSFKCMNMPSAVATNPISYLPVADVLFLPPGVMLLSDQYVQVMRRLNMPYLFDIILYTNPNSANYSTSITYQLTKPKKKEREIKDHSRAPERSTNIKPLHCLCLCKEIKEVAISLI